MTTTARNGMARRIWLHMLTEGGYWSSRELADALHVTTDQIEAVIYQMRHAGAVVHRPKADGRPRVTFGVTPSCKVPACTTLREILAANTEVLEAA